MPSLTRRQHLAGLAAKARRLREKEGMSFSDIARRLGVNPSTAGRLARIPAPTEREARILAAQADALEPCRCAPGVRLGACASCRAKVFLSAERGR